MNNRTMFPTLKNNAAASYQGPVKIELLKGLLELSCRRGSIPASQKSAKVCIFVKQLLQRRNQYTNNTNKYGRYFDFLLQLLFNFFHLLW